MDCTKLPRLPGRRTSLVLIVIIFVVPLASESTDDCFSNNDYTRQELELKLGDLLVEVEEALVQNRSLLDLVMQTIFNNDRCEIDFTITVFEASAGSGLEQHLPHNVTYRCPTAVPVELSQEIRDVNFQRATIECVLSVIISWIQVYAEAGDEIPKNWDQRKRGTIVSENIDTGFKFVNKDKFIKLGVTEYTFVTLTLALVVAYFFPEVHNKVILKATTKLEYQSLYWGTVMVSNTLTYGAVYMLFGVYRLFAINSIHFGNFNLNIAVPCVLEVVVRVILFVAAIIASVGSRQRKMSYVPIPSSLAKVTISFTFLWSCFCFCACCSPPRRPKLLRVLVTYSLMNFIYQGIMEFISSALLLFIEENRAVIIMLTMLYISVLFFLVLLCSYLLSNLFMSKPDFSRFKCIGGVCGLVVLIPTVVLLITVYMIIVISLNLRGLIGILTGIIPSVILSAGSWYIHQEETGERN